MKHSSDEKIEEIKKFLGIFPYHEPSNICRSDPYYAKYLEKKYGKDIDKLIDWYTKKVPYFT